MSWLPPQQRETGAGFVIGICVFPTATVGACANKYLICIPTATVGNTCVVAPAATAGNIALHVEMYHYSHRFSGKCCYRYTRNDFNVSIRFQCEQTQLRQTGMSEKGKNWRRWTAVRTEKIEELLLAWMHLVDDSRKLPASPAQ